MAKGKVKSLFDLLNDINNTKIRWSELTDGDKKSYSTFMVNRWLSMDQDYLELIASTQQHTMNMRPEISYEFYRDLLPKRKYYVKYISKKSEDSPEYGRLIDHISEYMLCSRTESEMMIDVLVETGQVEKIKQWLKKYGYNEKEISKLSKSLVR